MSAKVKQAVATCLAESSSSWDGSALVAYPAGKPQVTIMRTVIPPHTVMSMHRHAMINAAVVLRGELTVIAENGASHVFRAGDGIVEVVGTVHHGENRGDEEVDMIAFYAGEVGQPVSEQV